MLCSGADDFDKVHGQGSCSGIWWRALETQWQDVSTWFQKPCATMSMFCGTWLVGALGNAGAILCKHFPEDDFVWVTESHSGRRTQRRCCLGHGAPIRVSRMFGEGKTVLLCYSSEILPVSRKSSWLVRRLLTAALTMTTNLLGSEGKNFFEGVSQESGGEMARAWK